MNNEIDTKSSWLISSTLYDFYVRGSVYQVEKFLIDFFVVLQHYDDSYFIEDLYNTTDEYLD